MRRLAATVVLTAALVGAGASAAQAATPPALTTTGISVASSGVRTCTVTFSWTPSMSAQIDHFDYTVAASRDGLAQAVHHSTTALALYRSVYKSTGSWIALTPVLSDGSSAETRVFGRDSFGC